MMKKLTALLLCLSLLLSLAACSGEVGIVRADKVKKPAAEPEEILHDIEPEPEPEPEPPAAGTETITSGGRDSGTYQFPARTTLPFSEIRHDNYDAEIMKTALDDMEARCDERGAIDDLCSDFDIIADQFDRLSTDNAVLMVLYYLTIADEDVYAEYSAAESLHTEVADRLCTVLGKAVNSEINGDALIAYIGSDALVADVIDYVPMTEEEFALKDRRIELEDKYNNLDIEASDAAVQAANLYLELLDVMIAQGRYQEDYDSYTDYIYAEGFRRDYTPEQVSVLQDWAKDFGVEALVTTYNMLVSRRSALMQYYELELSEGEIVERVQPYVSSVSKTAADTFDRMVALGLYDLGASEEKGDGAFTITLPYYGTAYIFGNPYGYAHDLFTLIHEFGHYYADTVNMMPELYVYDCIDTCEIDSQGMEMLMLNYADRIFGKDLGDMARVYSLFQMFSTIMEGCIYDEFQQEAIRLRAEGKLETAAEVEALFLEIEGSYYGEYSEYFGRKADWWQVPHTFTSPFYYISYATSATAALGFLMKSEEDYGNAVTIYNELISIGNDKGFCNTLEAIGMPNPLETTGTAQLTRGLRTYLNSLK